MALYDSISLLGIFNRKAGRPATDAVTDASKYQRLAESQNRVVAMIAAIAPASLYPSVAAADLPQLFTDDYQVFGFGEDDNGNPIYPLGQGGIYPSLESIPDSPWKPGRDYMVEGTTIRIPNGGTYSGTLYWYGIMAPPDITANTQPVLQPVSARDLIVIDAVRQFASEGVRNPTLAAAMAAEWGEAWPTWCLAWKTQYKNGGALRWTGRQLAIASQPSL